MVLWGTRDSYFTTPGAIAYLRDAPWAEIHLLDSTHFASLEVPEVIAPLVQMFLRCIQNDMREEHGSKCEAVVSQR